MIRETNDSFLAVRKHRDLNTVDVRTQVKVKIFRFLLNFNGFPGEFRNTKKTN